MKTTPKNGKKIKTDDGWCSVVNLFLNLNGCWLDLGCEFVSKLKWMMVVSRL